MSAVTAQPRPFSHLKREKHIEALLHTFHNATEPPQVSQGSALSPGFQAEKEEKGQGDVHTAVSGRTAQRDNQHLRGYGLEGLAMFENVSQLCITAKPELQGPHCVPRRTYNITLETKEQLCVVVEESSCLCLHCCGPARSYSLRLYDRQARQLFLFHRPLRADACCLGCCLMEMRTSTADGQLVGTVHQRWSMFTPLFEVCDSGGNTLARIQGYCCPCRCYANQEFQVVSILGEAIGRIWKKWPGFNEQYNMDHEYFGLDVPQEMNLQTKLLLLAATFLLNHMFFEMS